MSDLVPPENEKKKKEFLNTVLEMLKKSPDKTKKDLNQQKISINQEIIDKDENEIYVQTVLDLDAEPVEFNFFDDLFFDAKESENKEIELEPQISTDTKELEPESQKPTENDEIELDFELDSETSKEDYEVNFEEIAEEISDDQLEIEIIKDEAVKKVAKDNSNKNQTKAEALKISSTIELEKKQKDQAPPKTTIPDQKKNIPDPKIIISDQNIIKPNLKRESTKVSKIYFLLDVEKTIFLFTLVIVFILIHLATPDQFRFKIPYLNQAKIFFPFSDNGLSLNIPDKGNNEIIIDESNIQGEIVGNSSSGRLFVIRGSLRNTDIHSRSYITLSGRLYDNNNKILQSRTVFAGNALSNNDLMSLPIIALEKRLSNRKGIENMNVNVQPDYEVLFTIVFSDFPDNFDWYSVEVSGSVLDGL